MKFVKTKLALMLIAVILLFGFTTKAATKKSPPQKQCTNMPACYHSQIAVLITDDAENPPQLPKDVADQRKGNVIGRKDYIAEKGNLGKKRWKDPGFAMTNTLMMLGEKDLPMVIPLANTMKVISGKMSAKETCLPLIIPLQSNTAIMTTADAGEKANVAVTNYS